MPPTVTGKDSTTDTRWNNDLLNPAFAALAANRPESLDGRAGRNLHRYGDAVRARALRGPGRGPRQLEFVEGVGARNGDRCGRSINGDVHGVGLADGDGHRDDLGVGERDDQVCGADDQAEVDED